MEQVARYLVCNSDQENISRYLSSFSPGFVKLAVGTTEGPAFLVDLSPDEHFNINRFRRMMQQSRTRSLRRLHFEGALDVPMVCLNKTWDLFSAAFEVGVSRDIDAMAEQASSSQQNGKSKNAKKRKGKGKGKGRKR